MIISCNKALIQQSNKSLLLQNNLLSICFFFQPAFENPARSIVKTGVMMIGEFDFDNIFNSDSNQDVPGVTWFIFILFLIIMTLILMNLLVRFLMTFISHALTFFLC